MPTHNLIPMTLPDAETCAFWRATEDRPGEAAERIARFSQDWTCHEADRVASRALLRPRSLGLFDGLPLRELPLAHPPLRRPAGRAERGAGRQVRLAFQRDVSRHPDTDSVDPSGPVDGTLSRGHAGSREGRVVELTPLRRMARVDSCW